MMRMVGAAVFFQSAVLYRDRRSAPRGAEPGTGWRSLGLRMHGKLLGLSALGVAINQAFFLTGLRMSSPFVATLIGATIPVFTAGLAMLLRTEPPSGRTGLGIALAFSGVFWLTGLGAAASGPSWGAVILALNSLSYSAYVVFSRDVVLALGSFRLMAWVFTYGAILFAPLGLHALVIDLPTLSARGVGLAAYIVLVPTILAYGLNAWALGRTTPSVVTIYIYTQPLIAGILARIQLGDTISSRATGAALLILGGVAVATLRRRPVT